VARFSPTLGLLMRVFQHSVTRRKSFYATKKCCVLFYATADAATALEAASSGAPQANGNDFWFFRNAGGELDYYQSRVCVQPMTAALRNTAGSCGNTATARCFALRCVTFSPWCLVPANAWFPPFRCRPAVAVSPFPLRKFRKNYVSAVRITLSR